MSYRIIIKFFVFGVLLIVLMYIALVFHLPKDKALELEQLYAELKNSNREELAFQKFKDLGEKACDYLFDKLPQEKDVSMKCKIIYLISEVNCKASSNYFLSFMYDQHWRVRFLTIHALNDMENNHFKNQLPEIIVNDPNINVKIKAIMVMGQHGNGGDIKFLQKLAAKKNFSDEKLAKAIDIALEELRSKLGIGVNFD